MYGERTAGVEVPMPRAYLVWQATYNTVLLWKRTCRYRACERAMASITYSVRTCTAFCQTRWDSSTLTSTVSSIDRYLTLHGTVHQLPNCGPVSAEDYPPALGGRPVAVVFKYSVVRKSMKLPGRSRDCIAQSWSRSTTDIWSA